MKLSLTRRVKTRQSELTYGSLAGGEPKIGPRTRYLHDDQRLIEQEWRIEWNNLKQE